MFQIARIGDKIGRTNYLTSFKYSGGPRILFDQNTLLFLTNQLLEYFGAQQFFYNHIFFFQLFFQETTNFRDTTFFWTNLFTDLKFVGTKISSWSNIFLETNFFLQPNICFDQKNYVPRVIYFDLNVVWRSKGKLECGSAQLVIYVFQVRGICFWDTTNRAPCCTSHTLPYTSLWYF